jgi:hypothetical protein
MRELNVVELNVVNGGGEEGNTGAGFLSTLWNAVPSGRTCLIAAASVAAVAAVGYAAYYGYNQYYGSNEAV